MEPNLNINYLPLMKSSLPKYIHQQIYNQASTYVYVSVSVNVDGGIKSWNS